MLSNTGITYADACQMSEDEIMEANAALDLMLEQMNKKQPWRNR